MSEMKSRTLWSDDKTIEDLEFCVYTSGADSVIYNLHEDLVCLKERIAELERYIEQQREEIIQIPNMLDHIAELESERDELKLERGWLFDFAHHYADVGFLNESLEQLCKGSE